MARKIDGKKARGVFEKVKGSGEWWVLYYDENGKRHREKVGPKSLAIDVYRKRKTEVTEAQFFPEKIAAKRRRVLVRDAIKSYMLESKASKRSWKDDDRYGRVWTEALGDSPMDSVRPADIEAWRREKAKDGAAPATINRHVAFLKRVFNVAKRDGRCKDNPVQAVKMHRENNARIRFLTPEEETKLQGIIPQRYWHYPELAILTGLRQGEQLSLRWEYIDFQTAQIEVPRSKHGQKRYVPMSARVMEILRNLPSRMKSEWVYPGEGGNRHIHYSTLRKTFWDDAIEQAGLKNDFRWHDLRHTAASRLVMSGVDLRTVQEILGHKTILMTQRYAHLAPSHLNNAMERLAKFTATHPATEEPTATATATSQNPTHVGEEQQALRMA